MMTLPIGLFADIAWEILFPFLIGIFDLSENDDFYKFIRVRKKSAKTSFDFYLGTNVSWVMEFLIC